MLPIKGSVTIEYEYSGKKFKKLLSFKKKNYLLLKPKSWATIKFHSDKSMLMVFCDREYEYKDYIRNYKDFLKVIKKMNLLITGACGHIGSFISQNIYKINKIKNLFVR